MEGDGRGRAEGTAEGESHGAGRVYTVVVEQGEGPPGYEWGGGCDEAQLHRASHGGVRDGLIEAWGPRTFSACGMWPPRERESPSGASSPRNSSADMSLGGCVRFRGGAWCARAYRGVAGAPSVLQLRGERGVAAAAPGCVEQGAPGEAQHVVCVVGSSQRRPSELHGGPSGDAGAEGNALVRGKERHGARHSVCSPRERRRKTPHRVTGRRTQTGDYRFDIVCVCGHAEQEHGIGVWLYFGEVLQEGGGGAGH